MYYIVFTINNGDHQQIWPSTDSASNIPQYVCIDTVTHQQQNRQTRKTVSREIICADARIGPEPISRHSVNTGNHVSTQAVHLRNKGVQT
jgi:hypothetical protein